MSGGVMRYKIRQALLGACARLGIYTHAALSPCSDTIFHGDILRLSPVITRASAARALRFRDSATVYCRLY